MAGSRVGIVGGGMLGMTLALRLRAQGHDVVLLESAPSPGGLASAERIGDYVWDRFYHVILLSDRHTRALLDELGLGDRLRWGVTRTGFYGDGRLLSLSTSLEYLRFPLLSLPDKARLAATILRASRLRDPLPLEAIPVEDWLTRLSGRRVYQRIWRPLLRSKLGENHRIASAAFIWAIVARMYAARRSGLKREMFGYVDGGYGLVLERFAGRLREAGVEIACGCRAEQVTGGPDGVTVRMAGGQGRRFDHVVLTLPASRIGGLCPQLTAAERVRLDRVVYQGIVCASLLLDRPLAGYYVTNIVDEGLPFTGVIEMTALVDRERFGGRALVYLPRYLAQDDPAWARSDAELEQEFLRGLERMYPGFRRGQVQAVRLARVREVLAVPTLHYSRDALPPLRTSIPGVYVADSAQIVNGTLNVNETVGLAETQARALAPLLRAGTAATVPA